jgi:hypothetical protein
LNWLLDPNLFPNEPPASAYSDWDFNLWQKSRNPRPTNNAPQASNPQPNFVPMTPLTPHPSGASLRDEVKNSPSRSSLRTVEVREDIGTLLSHFNLNERQKSAAGEHAGASPSKSTVSRRRVLTNLREVDGTLSSSQIGVVNTRYIDDLTYEFGAADRNFDIVDLHLRTHFTNEARLQIEELLEDDLPFSAMLERLSSAGLPAQEAFYILYLRVLTCTH